MFLFVFGDKDKSDEEKFKEVYRKYYIYTYKIAISVLGDIPEAEDIVQETFLSLWNHRKKIYMKHIKEYIGITVRNKSYDFLKKNEKTDKHKVDYSEDDCAELGGHNPEHIIINKEFIQCVYKEIKNMKKIYSDALILYYKLQLSVREIADCLDINEAAAGKRIRVGKRILAAKLTELERMAKQNGR